MATPTKNAPKLPPKPATPPQNTAAKTNGAEPATETKLSKRVTFWSAVVPTFSVRVLRTLAESNEAPWHGGQPMVRRSGRPAGGGGKQAKEAREKMLAGMSEEQKLAFITKEKEEKKAKKVARKEAERAAMKEQLRKELEAEYGAKK